MNDTELLQRFAEQDSENAFRMLVERHLPLVMGTARRITNNDSLAEEVAQAVYILLARKARHISSKTILAGWLYRTTCFVAARALRTEQRRQRREQEVAAMHTQTESDPLWQQIKPQLDEALGRLGNDNRNALVLRFFEDRSLRDVGTAMGTSEEAAKKRVQRALEKLRSLLSRRGIEIGAGALAVGLAQESAQAAVAAGLAGTITTAALSTTTAGGSVLAAETLAAWHWAKLKASLGIGAGAIAIAFLIPLIHLWTPQPNTPNTAITPATANAAIASIDAPVGIVPATIEVLGQTIALRPLQITVLDKLTGNPISGAQVRHDLMVSLIDITPLPPMQTDENGIVMLPVPDRIPEGDARMVTFDVCVTASGYASRTIRWLCNTGHVLSTVTNQYTVRLEPGTSLSGVVVDENGTPWPGIRVGALGNSFYGFGIRTYGADGKATSPPEIRVEDYSGYLVDAEKPGSNEVKTDRAGRFRLVHYPSDLRSLVIELVGEDGMRQKFRTPEGKKLTSDELPEVSLQDLRQGTARLVLECGIAVEGVVIDTSNNPVMDAAVSDYRFRWGMYRSFSQVHTDYAGRFKLPNVPRREIVLIASAEGFASVLTTAVARPEMASVQIQLPPEQPLRGRVIKESGEPMADAKITVSDVTDLGLTWSDKTDSEGRFCWQAAPIAEMAISITAREGGTRKVRLMASKEEQLITFRSQNVDLIRVTGKVFDAATKAPVEHFRVGISHQSIGGVLDKPMRFIEASQGVFSTQTAQKEVPVGMQTAWGLWIEADGYDPTCTRMYDFTEGDQHLDFALQPGGMVEGIILTTQGGPAAGAQLAFVKGHDAVLTSQAGQISSRYRSGTSDAEGRFKLAKPMDPQALVAFHDSGWAIFPLGKTAGNLKIRLQPWGRIEGSVMCGQTPVVGESVCLKKLVWSWSDALTPLYNATTDDTGHFVFEKVPAGEFQLSLAARAWQRRPDLISALETTARISAGETQTANLWAKGSSVLARLRAPSTMIQPVWSNTLAVLRRDVNVPPEPNRGNYTSASSLQMAQDNYAHDPAVLAAAREARRYIGTVASDGTVAFANIPAGRYVFEVQFFADQETRRRSTPLSDEDIVIARVRAAVSVSEAANTSEETPISIGEFTIESL